MYEIVTRAFWKCHKKRKLKKLAFICTENTKKYETITKNMKKYEKKPKNIKNMKKCEKNNQNHEKIKLVIKIMLINFCNFLYV